MKRKEKPIAARIEEWLQGYELCTEVTDIDQIDLDTLDGSAYVLLIDINVLLTELNTLLES
jgi:hypothetical protein